MNTEIAFSGIMCIIAMFVSFHHSREASIVSASVFVGFLFYICAWAPDGWSPRDIAFALTGEKVKSSFFWALCDIVVAVYIVHVAGDRLWVGVLAFLFMIQVCFHIVKIYEFMDKDLYYQWLDITFSMQMLTFLYIGFYPTCTFMYDRGKILGMFIRRVIDRYHNRHVHFV